MRNILTILLLTSLFAVGVLGFMGMNSDMHHEQGTCVASFVNAVVCPSEGLSSALYHMSAYASFTQAIFLPLLLLSLALSLFAYVFDGLPDPSSGRICVLARARKERTPQWRLIRWLSRFENSPTFA